MSAPDLGCTYHSTREGDLPGLNAHFFYSSSIPIDDPLSIPATAGNSEANFAKGSLRPFSELDNDALRKAWHASISESARKAGSVRHVTEFVENSIQQDEVPADSSKACTHEEITKETIVGVARLYLVKLPTLLMMPIYWSPIQDIVPVTRATWFYKNDMLPIEPAIANRLELGYIENRPWRDAWNDQLSSAIDEGLSSYQKLLYKLLRTEEIGEAHESNVPCDACGASTAHPLTKECSCGEFSAVGKITTQQGDSNGKNAPPIISTYSDSVVCYKDSKNAFILMSGFQQSYYYGAQSLSKIKRGESVGVHVVRGFDWEAWESLHSSKKPASAITNKDTQPTNAENTSSSAGEDSSAVTDLVFVVHGIGQKLSQRVESFHFTHAINSLRRSIDTDLHDPTVRKTLRKNLGGIAILPVNWRPGFNFEDSRSVIAGKDMKTNAGGFSLQDITPDSIPAVRSLISDVLLDIPFYMSSHKQRMIAAVVGEANRVYRLWCRNNPGFQTNGRVHVIGHSLGSALTLDVLSQQPTFVKPLSIDSQVDTKHFEFDTKNLFFIGSPVGFFLLLGGGKLMPRTGRRKPGIGVDDESGKDITGSEGTYGCMAVDNIYNVLHPNDPVAYQLNAAIDVDYAASLKKIEVPSAATNWMDTISKNITTGISRFIMKVDEIELTTDLSSEGIARRNYSHAEKRFHLLNDNGQVDYFLKQGDGPDIQYLNMLWAHSSYWTNTDFIRMLVTEIGREPGQRNIPAIIKTENILP